MKKLFTILFIISAFVSYGQGGWIRQNTTYGIRDYRRAFDSTMLFPAMNGIPAGVASLRAHSFGLPGIVGDTASKQAYLFWPKDSTWTLIGSSSVTGVTTGNYYNVEDSTNAPPVTFPVGVDTTYWMVGGAPTGDFTGLDYKIMMYVSGVVADTITADIGDFALTLDDGVDHRYDGITWPVTYARQWNTAGNFGGGILGSTNPAFVYLRYNNNSRIRLGGGGTFFTQLYGTNNAIATFNSVGLIQRREPVASSDTTANKPIGQAVDGTLYRMSYWPGSGGGGGGGEDLEATIDIGSTLTESHTIDHTGFTLETTGLNLELNADNVLRGAAVDSVAFTSLGTGDFQAGTMLTLAGVDILMKGSTSTSSGFGSGGTVTKGWNSNTVGTFLQGGANQTDVATIKQAVLDTVTGLIGWQNPSSGAPLTATYVGYGDPSNLLTGSANMTYASSVFNVFRNGIGATQTDGVTLQNSTPATVGVPEYSPRLNWFGSSWNTTGSAAISQGMGASFVTYSGASSGNVGHLAFTHYNAGYAATPTLTIKNLGIAINSSSTAIPAYALDVTEISGSGAMILRDDGGVASRTFSVGSTGTLTIGTSSGGTVSAGTFEGGLTTGAGGAGAVNLFAAINSNISNGAGAALAGSANLTSTKVISNGTTTQTPTANLSYANFYIGANAVTKAATGTHDIFTNGAIQGLNINSGAGTLTKATALLINGIATGTGAPAGAEDNLALWVFSGISRFGGEVLLRAGTATANTAPIKFVSGTNLTAVEAGAMEFDGTNLYFSPSSTRLTVALGLSGSATLNFDLTAVNYQDLTITVTGAADGDEVIVGAPNGAVVADVTYFGWVSAANTVTIRCSRVGGGGAADPASGTFKARVIK